MKPGQHYWTIYPTQIEDDEVLSDADLVREWVLGENPVFDELASKRCVIFHDKDEAIKVARAVLEKHGCIDVELIPLVMRDIQ